MKTVTATRWIARGLLLLWAAFWLFFNIASGIAELPGLGGEALTGHLITAGVVLITFLAAWRWDLAGGLMLLVLAVAVFLLFRLYLARQLLVLLTLALPMVIAGVLLLICWWHSRPSARPQRPA